VTVGGITSALRAGETTARALAEAALAAAERQPFNAFTLVDHEGARAAADAVDARLAAGEDPGPLAGVPIAVKDLLDQAGRVTTCGSSFLTGAARSTAPAVARLADAGAVIIGRTGLHEFAYGFSSENPWWGPVRNPWDPATSPGGSSGGSAAAVAAGIVAIAIGTDTGGSIRVPAALCGCAGLKVTHGRVPTTGVFPLVASLDTVGPIARSVADLADGYAVMADPHQPEDPTSRAGGVVVPGGPADLAGLVVGVPVPWTERRLAAPVANAFAAALDGMRSAGARVERIEIPELLPTLIPRATYAEAGDVHRAWFAEDPTRYGDDVRERLAVDLAHTARDVVAGAAWQSALRSAARGWFGRVDVLVTPTVPVLRKEIGVDLVDVDGELEPYRPALSWFTTPVNQLGVPALALPIGAGSPPPSLQVIGPWWAEARLLAIGLALEESGVASPGRVPEWP
jgi:Asp-tRNA(Asn)/Glu-tRNA(Gln) amidotransferase A subunit family amidase